MTPGKTLGSINDRGENASGFIKLSESLRIPVGTKIWRQWGPGVGVGDPWPLPRKTTDLGLSSKEGGEKPRRKLNWPGACELVLPDGAGLFTYLPNIKLSAKLEWTTPEQGLPNVQDGCSLPWAPLRGLLKSQSAIN